MTLIQRLIQRLFRRLFGRLLEPFLGDKPAAMLVRQTAREQARLLGVNLGCNLVAALSEGVTFGVIFLAVELLSNREAHTAVTWASKPLISWIPGTAHWLAGLPSTPLFLLLLALAVLLQALQSLSRYGGLVSIGYFAARCRARITARIHGQILRLSFPCASSYRVGDLTNHAAQGPEAIRIELELASQTVLTALMLVVYLSILVTLSPWLLLAALGLGGLILLVQRQLLPRLRHGAEHLAELGAQLSMRVTEDIQGLRLLHSSGQRRAAELALRSQMGALELSLRRQARLMHVIGPLSTLLPVVAIAVMGALSLLVFGSKTSGVLPSLVTFVLALQRLNGCFSSLANLVNEMANNSGRIERLNAILDQRGKAFVRGGGAPFRGLEREIRLDGVRLHYGNAGPAAVEGVDLVIAKGSQVALVGPSGAGKSSIADLLVGLYEPSDGRVLVDGIDLRGLDLESWQQRIGVVSQDTFLFNLTLAENIAFGCPWASRDDIELAATIAHATGFIQSLPQGFDTVVGERGFRLSGGQRQRVSLARAILRQPELLILDEATSALDSESERLVQQALDSAEQKRTALVIAHRLSTIMNVDQICVLEQGRIVERGQHLELLARGGRYAGLWNLQLDRAGSAALA